MEVHDILYIDVPRFESLASQRLFGLTQNRTVSETVTKGKGTAVEQSERAIHEAGGHQTGLTREIADLDNSFREFLEAIEGNVLRVPSSLDQAKNCCENAIRSGQFVRAQGSLYYNDFLWLKNISHLWAKQQESLIKMNGSKKEARTDFESTKKILDHAWCLADFAFGESIECGVALGQADSGLLVKAVLDRKHLRIESPSFIDRYGTKTHCHFTILGTLARLGWQKGVDIIEKLSESAADTDQGMLAFKKSMEEVQETALNIRRNAGGGDEHSVYVMPLAVYRSSPLNVE